MTNGRYSLLSFGFVALALSGFFYFEMNYDLPVFTLSKFGEKFRNARFAEALQRQYISFDIYDEHGYFLDNDSFQFDPVLGTVNEITIRVDLPGADRLLAGLKKLSEIPKVQSHRPI